MFYRKPATTDARHPNQKLVRTVTTLPLHSKVLEQCDKRGDVWASEVQTRLHGCSDLVATEAVYHSKCLTQFMLNKKLEQATDSASKIKVDLKTKMMLHWFKMLCQWLESEAGAESYTLTELHKMKEISDNSEVYVHLPTHLFEN